MGLFGFGKKKQEEDNNSIELQRQMAANPQQIESNPQSTMVQEENASFQVPDFSEEDLNFDLDLNEFLPDIRKDDKDEMINSGAEQQDLERIMSASSFGEKEDEDKQGDYGFGGAEIEKADETVAESNENVDHAEIKIENPTINITQPELPKKSKAKQMYDETQDEDILAKNLELSDEITPEKPSNEIKKESSSESIEEIKEDIPEEVIREVKRSNYKPQEKEDDLPKFDLNKSSEDDLVPSEIPFVQEDELTQEVNEPVEDEEDPLSADFNNDEISDVEPISNFGDQEEENIDLEKDEPVEEHELLGDEKYIEKEEFKHILHKEDELNEESKNNQIFADKLKKYNKEQNDLFNITEDLIQEVKSKLLELDQRLFETNQVV